MTGYNSFEDMPVWRKAMDLAVGIFGLTERLPRKEDFGLVSQIRRSGLSVSGNIAKGFGKRYTKDKIRFYYHARGSLAETKSHLIYGFRVKYFKESEFEEFSGLLQETWRELNLLISSMSKKAQLVPLL